MTVVLKNNRNENPKGDWVFDGDVTFNGDIGGAALGDGVNHLTGTFEVDGVSTFNDDVTLAVGADVVLNTTGTKIGTATTQKLSFYNATPIAQRSGSAQAAVATTSATNSSPYGYSQAQADALVTLVNELRAALVAVGLIKGSA